MLLVYSLLSVLALSLIFTSSIRKNPKLYYAIASTIAILTSLYELFGEKYKIELTGLLFLFEKASMKGFISIGFFILVMYAGALNKKLSLCKKLLKIRAQLAIMGSILILPHCVVYSYYIIGGMIKSKTLPNIHMIHLIVGFIAFLVMIPLYITSFKKIRYKMKFIKWKKLQRWSYLFYFLTYLHIMLIILKHQPLDIFSMSLYTIIFGLYFALKVLKLFEKRRVTIKFPKSPLL